MTRTSFRAIVIISCLALALAALVEPRQSHAQSDQWNALYDRIIRLEHQVRDLSRSGNPATAGESGYRVAAMEDQLRQILGALDEIRRAQWSLEQRLQQLEGSPRSTGSIFDQQPAPYQQRADSFDFSQYQARDLAELSAEQDVTVQVYRAPGPRVLGTISGSQLYEPGQLPGSPDNTGPGLVPETVERAALDGSPLPDTGDGSADRLYERAYESLLGRRFSDAEGGFKLFLDRHGDHPLASDAHYWLGETYYVQGDYKQAAQSFLKGYRGYPEGRKAPDTLFKLGLSLQHLQQKPQACSTFAEVAKNYPKAANVRNDALKEMQRAGC